MRRLGGAGFTLTGQTAFQAGCLVALGDLVDSGYLVDLESGGPVVDPFAQFAAS